MLLFKNSATDPPYILLNTCVKLKVKVKVNFTLEHAMKAQRGIRSIALIFL
jgi:hypothetical protein